MRKNLGLKTVFLLFLLFAFASIAQTQQAPANQPPPGPPPKLVKIQDDLYMIENTNATVSDIGNYGGNVTVYITNEGVVLVDSKNERMHDDIVTKVKSLTDKPIRYLILTHNHGDHAGGAAKMQAIGATIIISANDRENLARVPNPQWLPQFGHGTGPVGSRRQRSSLV